MTFLGARRIFPRGNEMEVAEEYCWAITQAIGLSFCDR
jgi:hypothetical protein